VQTVDVTGVTSGQAYIRSASVSPGFTSRYSTNTDWSPALSTLSLMPTVSNVQ